MNKSSMRLLALSVIFIGAFSVARASVASADFWGGFRFAGASNGDFCLPGRVLFRVPIPIGITSRRPTLATLLTR